MNIKRLVSILGSLLAVIGVVFLARRIVALELWRQDVNFGELAPVLALSALAYALACLSLGGAWMVLLQPRGVSLRRGIAWHLAAQIGKYLPGNVAHFAGRHVMFARAGVPQPRLIKAAAGETVLVVLAGLILGVALSPQIAGTVADHLLPDAQLRWLAIAGIAALTVAIVGVLAWRLKRQLRLSALAIALYIYLVFFSISGLALAALTHVLQPALGGHVAMFISAGSLAWLCGYLVPGAPGGLGIREAVLVLTLTPAVGAQAALLAALSHRAATIGGDGIAALAALIALRWRSGAQGLAGRDRVPPVPMPPGSLPATGAQRVRAED